LLSAHLEAAQYYHSARGAQGAPADSRWKIESKEELLQVYVILAPKGQDRSETNAGTIVQLPSRGSRKQRCMAKAQKRKSTELEQPKFPDDVILPTCRAWQILRRSHDLT
jgi:hypothetical protein